MQQVNEGGQKNNRHNVVTRRMRTWKTRPHNKAWAESAKAARPDNSSSVWISAATTASAGAATGRPEFTEQLEHDYEAKSQFSHVTLSTRTLTKLSISRYIWILSSCSRKSCWWYQMGRRCTGSRDFFQTLFSTTRASAVCSVRSFALESALGCTCSFSLHFPLNLSRTVGYEFAIDSLICLPPRLHCSFDFAV